MSFCCEDEVVGRHIDVPLVLLGIFVTCGDIRFSYNVSYDRISVGSSAGI